MGFRSLFATSLDAFTSLPVSKRSIQLVLGAGLVLSPVVAQAQIFNGGGLYGRAVGGVHIDADGVLRNVAESSDDLEVARANLIGATGELAQATNSRLISLSAIRDLVLKSNSDGTPIPEEAAYLGGLTRVENIFVYPDRNDIVIAGPAEPWAIGPNGTVVGTKTGRPVIHLDDLLNALKTVEDARKTGISVSIEPTPEGSQRLKRLLSQVRLNGAQVNWASLEGAMREAFGPQQVLLNGVSPNSHMARVILAADYKMKLYGMNLAEAPVAGLPSYLEMVRSSSSRNLQSRWWMAADYDSIEHSKDRTAWKLNGRGIKTMTEEEHMLADGTYKSKGKADAVAQKWADLFTSKLDQLAVKEPVFGELRNIMDLCVVAAIIESYDLQSLAQCDLKSLVGDSSQVNLIDVQFPKSLDPQCSFVQTAQGFLVSASGGVEVNSWLEASKAVESDKLAAIESGKQWKDSSRIWQ